MSQTVVPSADVCRRVHEAEITYTRQRLGVLHRLPGNPVQIEIEDLGDGGWYLQARYIPNMHFNRVCGLTEAHVPQLEGLLARFRSAGVNGGFDVVPGVTAEAVIDELRRLGLSHGRFHSTMAGVPSAARPASPGVTVEVVTPQTFEAFLDTHCRGWAVPQPEGFKANVQGWIDEPDWTLYLGRLNGRPAGTAVLSRLGDIGYCADAACDPAFRGHGVHAALLHRRLEDAGNAGCSLVTAGADVLSTSCRNMVRAGLGLLYNKSVWMAR